MRTKLEYKPASEATYLSYKNKEIEWYMCDLNRILKLLVDLDLSVEAELYDFSTQHKGWEKLNSFDEGILVGRAEFANQLWNIINKGERSEQSN